MADEAVAGRIGTPYVEEVVVLLHGQATSARHVPCAPTAWYLAADGNRNHPRLHARTRVHPSLFERRFAGCLPDSMSCASPMARSGDARRKGDQRFPDAQPTHARLPTRTAAGPRSTQIWLRGIRSTRRPSPQQPPAPPDRWPLGRSEPTSRSEAGTSLPTGHRRARPSPAPRTAAA